jgi:predicted nucleic acid-binding Zn ribbon protein
MTSIIPPVCPACGAHNETDANFCDQCAEGLEPATVNTLATETQKDPRRQLMNILTWFVISSLILFGPILVYRHHQANDRSTKRDWSLVVLANILDAQAITGQGMPAMAELGDVKNYEGIHEFSFLDSASLESIIVFIADSKPEMTVNEMMAAWKAYTRKIVARDKRISSVDKWLGSGSPRIVRQKILHLKFGVIFAEQVRVPLSDASTADGIQAHFSQRGKSYQCLAYGKPFSESALIKFLDEWQSAPYMSASQLPPQLLSAAYCKRGKWRAKLVVRVPDAIADFRKALGLDPHNLEAQAGLQALKTAPAKTDGANAPAGG